MVWYKGCVEEGRVVVVEGQGGAVDGVGYGFARTEGGRVRLFRRQKPNM
jgi:hypothetical protein